MSLEYLCQKCCFGIGCRPVFTMAEKHEMVAHAKSPAEVGATFHHEGLEKISTTGEDTVVGKSFDIDSGQLPPGYFRTLNFWGSIFAIYMGFAAGGGVFTIIAPSLPILNKAIGPSSYISWVAITYSLCGAVGSLPVGRLSDIFGRRWFFISGSVSCQQYPSPRNLLMFE